MLQIPTATMATGWEILPAVVWKGNFPQLPEDQSEVKQLTENRGLSCCISSIGFLSISGLSSRSVLGLYLSNIATWHATRITNGLCPSIQTNNKQVILLVLLRCTP